MTARKTGVALAVSIAVSGPAHATGFFVNQQSVKGLGRVNAGVTAAAEDPSTIAFNPAGLANLWPREGAKRRTAAPGDSDTWAMFGAQTLVPLADLRNGNSTAATPGTLGTPVPTGGVNFSDPGEPTPLPNVYFARKVGDDVAVGVGINAPFGLGTEFSHDWWGRYDAIEASLATLNITFAGAYAFSPRLSIGAGLDIQYARSKLVTAIPNPLTPGGPTVATDARGETKGHAWSPGFNVGVLWSPDDATRVGVQYRSGVHHDIKGIAVTSGFTGLLAGANGVVGAKAKLKLPAIVNLGVAHDVGKLTLMGQLEWYNWSKFDEIRVRFDNGATDGVRATNYRDTWAAAVGADYRMNDRWIFRTGVRYDRTPTQDGFRDTTFPDGDRIWVGLGATYKFDRSWHVDLGFKHAFFEKGRIDATRTFFDGTPFASSVRVNGTAENSSVTTLSVNVGRTF